MRLKDGPAPDDGDRSGGDAGLVRLTNFCDDEKVGDVRDDEGLRTGGGEPEKVDDLGRGSELRRSNSVPPWP